MKPSGKDPHLTSRMGVRFVKHIQGDGTHENYMKAAACAKHFAVHSGPESLRHEFNAEVSRQDLYETYLPAFKACVQEGKVEKRSWVLITGRMGNPVAEAKPCLRISCVKNGDLKTIAVSDCLGHLGFS